MDCKRAAPSGVARPLQYVRSGLRADLPMSGLVSIVVVVVASGTPALSARHGVLRARQRFGVWRFGGFYPNLST